MTIKIRRNVFETNSSSTHSLTMSAKDVVLPPFDKAVLREGVFRVLRATYGWEFYRYYTAANKMSYLLTQLMNNKTLAPLSDVELTRLLREDYPGLDKLCRVVEDFTGVEVLFVDSEGYVDGDSFGVGLELLSAPDEELRNFLFDMNAYVETSNDNSPAPVHMPTDKGAPDETYGAHYAIVPADFVPIKISYKPYRWQPLTEDGGILALDSTVWERILAEGVVTSITWFEEGPYTSDRYHDTRAYSMKTIRSYSYGEDGKSMRFTANLHVGLEKVEDSDKEKNLLVVQVSPAVAKSYRDYMHNAQILKKAMAAEAAKEGEV